MTDAQDVLEPILDEFARLRASYIRHVSDSSNHHECERSFRRLIGLLGDRDVVAVVDDLLRDVVASGYSDARVISGFVARSSEEMLRLETTLAARVGFPPHDARSHQQHAVKALSEAVPERRLGYFSLEEIAQEMRSLHKYIIRSVPEAHAKRRGRRRRVRDLRATTDRVMYGIGVLLVDATHRPAFVLSYGLSAAPTLRLASTADTG